jgi:hypothetical protein
VTARDGGNAGFAGAKTCLQCALIAELAVGQSGHIFIQRDLSLTRKQIAEKQ